MSRHPSISIATALTIASIPAALFTSCEKKSDPVTEAAKEEENAGVSAPSIEEVKQIAEEGFVYGLPLVMACTASCEFWVDKTSSQYKGPFNALFNESRVFTPKDTAVITPNSDTPYSFPPARVPGRRPPFGKWTERLPCGRRLP